METEVRDARRVRRAKSIQRMAEWLEEQGRANVAEGHPRVEEPREDAFAVLLAAQLPPAVPLFEVEEGACGGAGTRSAVDHFLRSIRERGVTKRPSKLAPYDSASALDLRAPIPSESAGDSQCQPGHVSCGSLVVRWSGWSVGLHPFPELLQVGVGYELREDPGAVLVMVLRELYQALTRAATTV